MLSSTKHKCSWRKQRFRSENWEYDPTQDEYLCPVQQRLTYRKTPQHTTDHGYLTSVRVYGCDGCATCPLKLEYTRVEGNRRIWINPTLKRYHQQAHEKLVSDQGRRLHSRRAVEVETVFGRIKEDWGFRLIWRNQPFEGNILFLDL
jgi:transposase